VNKNKRNYIIVERFKFLLGVLRGDEMNELNSIITVTGQMRGERWKVDSVQIWQYKN
jgi:hypothetical protein